MISDKLFLIDVRSNQFSFARTASLAITRFLGVDLQEISCEVEPNKRLMDLKNKKGIVYLSGDAAIPNHLGLSWLESLGYWKQPVVLMISPDDSGTIPGIASAYVSLCNSKEVFLLGIIQLGGGWDQKARRLDCLPWCGKIPDELLLANSRLDSITLDQSLALEDIVLNIKEQIVRYKL